MQPFGNRLFEASLSFDAVTFFGCLFLFLSFVRDFKKKKFICLYKIQLRRTESFERREIMHTGTKSVDAFTVLSRCRVCPRHGLCINMQALVGIIQSCIDFFLFAYFIIYTYTTVPMRQGLLLGDCVSHSFVSPAVRATIGRQLGSCQVAPEVVAPSSTVTPKREKNSFLDKNQISVYYINPPLNKNEKLLPLLFFHR